MKTFSNFSLPDAIITREAFLQRIRTLNDMEKFYKRSCKDHSAIQARIDINRLTDLLQAINDQIKFLSQN